MFSFMKKITLFLFVSAALSATDLPITPNEAADLKNLGKGVNTPDSEYTPYITPNEKYLFFQSNRSPSVGPEGDFDLWYAINKNYDKPGDPLFESSANVGLPINSESLDGHPTLRRLVDGGYEMYFSSFATATRPGPALTNIYYTVWKGGKWTVPVPVVEVNSDFHDRMPSISQDGRFLLFSSDRLGGKGGDDIWVSEFNLNTGKWGEPKNAGNINTSASEVTPAIHADGTTLYFSSNQSGGVGGYDIYFTQSLSRLEDENEADIMAKGWSKPMNIGKPFNSEFDDEYPTVIGNGERVYFTSNRSEGVGAFDIYRARVPLFARPIIHLSLSGRITAGRGRRSLSAKVQLAAGNLKAKTESSADKKGAFALKMVNQKLYKFTVTADGYRTHSEEFDARTMHSEKEIVKNIDLVRDVKLPKNLALKITVTDSAGKAVKAKYRIVPKKKKFTAIGNKAVQLLSLEEFSGDEAKALTALEGYVLEVSADKKGHEPLRTHRDLAEVMDQYKNTLPEVMDTKFVMVVKGGVAVASKPVAPVKEDVPDKEDAEAKNEDSGSAGTATLKYFGRVYFADNVHDKALGDTGALVSRVKAGWKKLPQRKIYIYGHGDSRGTAEYNRKLSKLRAEFVRKKLIAAGIPANRIVAKGAGKVQRRVKNDDTAAKRQKNRRSEIYLSVPGNAAAAPADTQKPAVEKPEAAKPEKPAAPAEAAKPVGEPANAEKPAEKEGEKPAEAAKPAGDAENPAAK